MNTTLNTLAVGIFLVFNLAIGLYASRGIKTMRDYALAGKNLGIGALTATLLVTLLDVGNIGLKTAYSRGFISQIYPITFVVGAICLGMFVFPSFKQFKRELTIAEVMHTLYGPIARFITICVMSLFSFLVILGQLSYLRKVSVLLRVDANPLILITGILITLYTCLGGVRAVAKTDIVQFGVICIGFLALFLVISKSYGSPLSILKHINNKEKYLAFFKHKNFGDQLLGTTFWSLWPTLLISPPVIQRVLMTRKKRQIQYMFFGFGVIYIALRFLMLWNGLGLMVDAESKNIELKSVSSLIMHGASNHPFVQALFLVTIFAIIISTMDSFLNALSIIWVNDVFVPLANTPRKSINRLKYVRVATILIGFLCTIMALFISAPPLALVGYASMSISVLAVPLLLGVFGLRSSSTPFLASIIAFLGGFIPLFFNKVRTYVINILTGFLINENKDLTSDIFEQMLLCWYGVILFSAFVFFVTHYLENKGFVFVDYQANVWRERKRYTLRPYFKWLRNPIAWANGKAAVYGTQPYLAGIVTLAVTMSSLLLDTSTLRISYITLGICKMIPIGLCLLLIATPHWANWAKPYAQLFYYITMGYCWAFLAFFMVLADPTNGHIFVYLGCSLLCLSALVDWGSFVLLTLLGGLGAYIANVWLSNPALPFALDTHASILFILSIALPAVYAACFTRQKNESLKQAQQEIHHLLATQKETILTYEDSHEQVYETLHKDSSMMQAVKKVVNTLKQEGMTPSHLQTIEAAMGHFYAIAQRAKEYLYIQPKRIVLANLLDKIYATLRRKGIDPEDQVELYTKNVPATLIGDAKHLHQLFINSIAYVIEQQPEAACYVYLDQAWLDYELPAIYKGKPEAAYRISITTASQKLKPNQHYKPYASHDKTIALQHIGLLQNRRITHAHYGYFDLQQQGKKITQTYVLPRNLSTIRPKISKFASEDLAHITQITSPADQAFLDQVKSRGLAYKKIEFALKIAKHCHQHQVRKSGEAFYLHPLAVASLLLDQWEALVKQFNFTKAHISDLCIAALLHDTIEDTTYTTEQMIAMFGTEVAGIVGEVTHLYRKAVRPKMKLGKSKTLDALITGGNLRSLLIKLLDRVHNMRTIHGQPPHKQKRIAQETKDIFIPIAQKLNLVDLTQELIKRVKTVLT